LARAVAVAAYLLDREGALPDRLKACAPAAATCRGRGPGLGLGALARAAHVCAREGERLDRAVDCLHEINLEVHLSTLTHSQSLPLCPGPWPAARPSARTPSSARLGLRRTSRTPRRCPRKGPAAGPHLAPAETDRRTPRSLRSPEPHRTLLRKALPEPATVRLPSCQFDRRPFSLSHRPVSRMPR
jgi:hypothetical protein